MNMEPKMIILFALVALSLLLSAISLFKSCNCNEQFIQQQGGCGCNSNKKPEPVIIERYSGIDGVGADEALDNVKEDNMASNLITAKYNHTNQYVKNILKEAPANVIVPF